jgi:hypothetical protein
MKPRHRFIAEAFISLEMVSEGIEHMRAEIATAGTDADRFSATLVLCQMLLLADRKAEFVECAMDRLLPLTGTAMPNAAPGRETAGVVVAWTLLPLAADKFTAALPEPVVRRVSGKVATALGRTDDIDFACQLVLRTSGRRLKDVKLTEGAHAKLADHPARTRWNLTDGEVDAELLARVQNTALALEAFRDAFGADPALRPAR